MSEMAIGGHKAASVYPELRVSEVWYELGFCKLDCGRLFNASRLLNITSLDKAFVAYLSVSRVGSVRLQGNSIGPFIRSTLTADLDAINAKASQFHDVVKIGRTHLQDAVPMTFGQELGSFGARLSNTIGLIRQGVKSICNLAVGGTAVGTGLNSTKGFDLEMCDGVTELVEGMLKQRYGDTASKYMKLTFTPAENKFAALAGHDDLLQLSSCFNQTATILFKLAGDFALLSSGPSCGLGELILPPNEPGSSIMPGKVNPTQCEALRMVSLQVMGNHFTTSMAASLGQLQLNVFKPLIVAKMLHSCRLLRDAAISFTRNCVEGLQINHRRVEEHVRNSLMLVTALTPHIGYDKAARLAKHAKENNLTLREAALKLNMVSAEEFDQVVRPASMAFPFSEENMNNN
ncbi:fumarate hydratase class II [Clonorchis sinensis]|uniref:fumarate hydratase n=1 Tax=Clonorchis sinensis TaxID=79923 RepID=H2KPR1_CLOSI|nr:fumarate hydratase class II [Clonorchis sinensis]